MDQENNFRLIFIDFERILVFHVLKKTFKSAVKI